MAKKISNAEYIKRLHKTADTCGKAGYYHYAQYYRNRADTEETAERARLALLVKEK